MPRVIHVKKPGGKVAKKSVSASVVKASTVTASPKVSKIKKVSAKESLSKDEQIKHPHPSFEEMIIFSLMDLKKKVTGVRLKNYICTVYAVPEKSNKHLKKVLDEMTKKGFLTNDKESSGLAGLYHLTRDAVKNDEKMKLIVEKHKHKLEAEQPPTLIHRVEKPVAKMSASNQGKKTMSKTKTKKTK